MRQDLGTVFLNQQLLHGASDPNVLIVHPHAQRTGGGTLRNRIFATAYGQDRVYSRLFVPDFKPWAQLTDDDLRGYCAYTDLFDYCDLPLSRKCLPVAILREPVFRAVSLCHLVRRKETNQLHRLSLNRSLEEFYSIASRRNPEYFRNVQTTRICGRPDAKLAIEYILTRYLAVGFTDCLGEFAGNLCRIFRWPGVNVENRTPGLGKYETEITKRFREMVLSQNHEDVLLFEAMSRGPPYRIPTGGVRSAGLRRIKRTRDSVLIFGRRARRRLNSLRG